MLSKRPQSELVLIHVVTLNYFPLLDDAYNHFRHRIFSNVTPTPYRTHPYLGRLGPGYHWDETTHPKPNSKNKKHAFFASLFVSLGG